MNWCQPHWDRLKEIITEKGLDKFISKDAADALGTITGENEKFDPLMGSWSRINSAMLRSPQCNGRILECPLCILVADGQPELVENWLQGVTNSALNYAISAGLIQKN